MPAKGEAGDVVTESMVRAQEEAEREERALEEKEEKEAAAAEAEEEEGAPREMPTLLRVALAQPERAAQGQQSKALLREQAAEITQRENEREAQLDSLLFKASQYSGFILQQQAQAQAQQQQQPQEDAAAATNEEAGGLIQQPPILTGGTLKDYQLDGLRWLVSLFENGLSGILADEMGLGKTIQVIALFAHLRTRGCRGPYLITAPLATLPNWVQEFKKWCPSMPVLLYHGTKAERATLRRTHMPTAAKHQHSHQFPVIVTSYELSIIDRPYLDQYEWCYLVVDEGQRLKNFNCELVRQLKRISCQNRILLTGTPIQNTLEELWSLLNFVNPKIFDDLAVFQSWFAFRQIGQVTKVEHILSQQRTDWVVTKLHEILRPFLLRRLKCDVLADEVPPKREIVVYCGLSELQVRLYQAIMNYRLKETLALYNVEGANRTSEINKDMNLRKACNHPFLFGEPRDDDGNFITDTGHHYTPPPLPAAASAAPAASGDGRRPPRRLASSNADAAIALHAAFDSGAAVPLVGEVEPEEEQEQDQEQEQTQKQEKKQNQVERGARGQHDEQESAQRRHVVDNDILIQTSGKLRVLHRLLKQLRQEGHKVLIFSQMTQVLDILQDYLDQQEYGYRRIDGSVHMTERQQGINDFNNDPSVFCFLLSTRAGGLGINLAAADTCIIFDSDWNPHQDSQAQDRCHRIGQLNPVVVYRLVTLGSVEIQMMEAQQSKRKLERMAIVGGDYKLAGRRSSGALSVQDLERLLEDDLHGLCDNTRLVDRDISDEELALITDRRRLFAESASEDKSSSSALSTSSSSSSSASSSASLSARSSRSRASRARRSSSSSPSSQGTPSPTTSAAVLENHEVPDNHESAKNDSDGSSSSSSSSDNDSGSSAARKRQRVSRTVSRVSDSGESHDEDSSLSGSSGSRRRRRRSPSSQRAESPIPMLGSMYAVCGAVTSAEVIV